MLNAQNITVRYGKRAVLDGLDFNARAGALTAIVGPNGSGKSTLLGAITGALPHTGAVTLNGQDTAHVPATQMAAIRAVLPQASVLAFPFSVIEVVQIGLSAGPHGLRDDLPMQALARVGLGHYAGRIFHDLSGGEQQRVMLARVLVQVWEPVVDDTPRWLFLDEPVASLDIAYQLEVMQIAQGFARAGGGVVAVMHDLNLTALYADAVAVLRGGQILAHGLPHDVMTDDILSRAYGCALRVNMLPPASQLFILPHSAQPPA